MSLLGALNLGTSGLAAAQTSIQVTGNNIANAGNADYSRETVSLTDAPSQQISPGIFLGEGVDLTSVQRQVNDALQARLNGSVSDTQAATTTQQWLSNVQSTFNALSGQDLSTQMGSFFNAWSNLANNPSDAGLRQVVLQDGENLARNFNTINTQLADIQSNITQTLKSQAQNADSLASQVATINGQIVTAQGGAGGQANALQDQRDALLKKLSGLMNIQTVPQASGMVNVYVGSDPLVFGTQSSGVAVASQTANRQPASALVFKTTGGSINVASGELGALTSVQSQVGGIINQVNGLAHNMIFQLNELHSNGQGLTGITNVTSTNAVADPTAALSSAAADLPFTPVNGSFVVHVLQSSTGLSTSTLIPVQLTGSPTDSSLNSIAAALNGISGVSATVSGGKLSISSTSSSAQISFSQDSSSVLASLGINTFFSGKDASSIAVNSTIANQPDLIAAAKNGNTTDNQTALSIASLASKPLASLKGNSLDDTYQGIINTVGNQTAAATTQAKASQAVQDTLQSQRDSLSGVSLDEEMVNLMKQQTAYQGAARLISTVDQLTKDLMTILA